MGDTLEDVLLLAVLLLLLLLGLTTVLVMRTGISWSWPCPIFPKDCIVLPATIHGSRTLSSSFTQCWYMAHELEELLPLRVCSCVAFHRVNAQIVGFVSRDSFKLVFSFSQASSSLCDRNSSTKLKTRKQRPQTSTSMLANSSWATEHQVHIFVNYFFWFSLFYFSVTSNYICVFANFRRCNLLCQHYTQHQRSC